MSETTTDNERIAAALAGSLRLTLQLAGTGMSPADGYLLLKLTLETFNESTNADIAAEVTEGERLLALYNEMRKGEQS